MLPLDQCWYPNRKPTKNNLLMCSSLALNSRTVEILNHFSLQKSSNTFSEWNDGTDNTFGISGIKSKSVYLYRFSNCCCFHYITIVGPTLIISFQILWQNHIIQKGIINVEQNLLPRVLRIYIQKTSSHELKKQDKFALNMYT